MHATGWTQYFYHLRLMSSCRAKDAINEHLGTNNVTTMQLDVAQFDNIRKFVDTFLARDEPLRILINNAGVHLPGGWSDSPEVSGQRTPEGFEVRAAGHLRTPGVLGWELPFLGPTALAAVPCCLFSMNVLPCFLSPMHDLDTSLNYAGDFRNQLLW